MYSPQGELFFFAILEIQPVELHMLKKFSALRNNCLFFSVAGYDGAQGAMIGFELRFWHTLKTMKMDGTGRWKSDIESQVPHCFCMCKSGKVT